MLKAMLDSWDADVPQQNVHLSANHHEGFTRQAFVDVLYPVAQALKDWGNGSLVPSGAEREVSGPYTKRRVCVCLRDWEVWKNWWWMHVQECFPTFAKPQSRLRMSYFTRKCSSGPFSARMSYLRPWTPLAYHSDLQWKDSDALSPTPVVCK